MEVQLPWMGSSLPEIRVLAALAGCDFSRSPDREGARVQAVPKSRDGQRLREQ
jgi:hypothetical protein